jgi:hypothetical protein
MAQHCDAALVAVYVVAAVAQAVVCVGVPSENSHA